MFFNDLLTDQRNEKFEKYSQLKKYWKNFLNWYFVFNSNLSFIIKTSMQPNSSLQMKLHQREKKQKSIPNLSLSNFMTRKTRQKKREA